MVGDRESDIDAGVNANIRSVAVCTGKHDANDWARIGRPGLPVFPSLVEFVASLEIPASAPSNATEKL